MARTIRYRIPITSIDIEGLGSDPSWSATSQFSHSGVAGTIAITLDPDFIEWASYEWNDPETGEELEHEMVATHCSGLTVEASAEFPEGSKLGFILGTFHLILVEALDRFVSYLRLGLGQSQADLGPIRDWGLWDLITHGRPVWVKGEIEETIGYPLGGFPKGLPPSAPRPTYPHLSRSLTQADATILPNWDPAPLPHSMAPRLLADARKHLYQGDRRAAAIEAVTAMEASLEPFIRRRCRDKGVTSSALDNYDKTHFIGDYLKLLLPLILAPGELQAYLATRLKEVYCVPYAVQEENILEWCVELNRVRNDAVHRGLDPAFEAVDKGLFAADLLVAFAAQQAPKS